PPGKQRNVEAVLARHEVAALLGGREKIEEQRPPPGALQLAGDVRIARTETAAPTTMRKKHDSARAAVGDRKIARQQGWSGPGPHLPRNGLGNRAHRASFAPLPRPSLPGIVLLAHRTHMDLGLPQAPDEDFR